ncbi:MAG TPA: DUF4956 domain-containing protein [Pyrinomonadaceae bacterium]|nr:DUF4956 domain-containing protein [Pyrinomonadaceae bacterium]
MKKPLVRILVVFVVVLLGSALLVYALLERSNSGSGNPSDRAATSTNLPDGSPGASPVTPPANGNHSVLKEIFGIDESTKKTPEQGEIEIVAARVILRFLIAAFLAMLLAFRWRRDLSITKRNPYVAQTQILLAVVAAAMMMIVGDSAARAFGIFAAASLVRFRTNIRDPKETTVLLICLGVGLACGVGRLDMAFILTIFVLLGLLILEYFETEQVFRAMEVRVQTRNVDQTHQVLKGIFAKYEWGPELRQLEREAVETEGAPAGGTIVYELNLGYAARTDQLTEEILAEDAQNIAGLEWEQKKSSTYIYN